MSVENYCFRCSKCGHMERQCEGIYLFSDKCYFMWHCYGCGKVDSIALTQEEYESGAYPECCGFQMHQWDQCCPSCGNPMTVIENYSDVI